MPETSTTKDCPLWKRESFWAGVLGVIFMVPDVVEAVLPFLPKDWDPAIRAIGAACLAISIQYGRKPGAQAREKVQAVETKADVAVTVAEEANLRAAKVEQSTVGGDLRPEPPRD